MDNANDFPGSVLVTSRGGLELRAIDHTFKGWAYLVDSLKNATGLDGHSRHAEGFVEKYFEWMAFGDQRLFLFRNGVPFLVGVIYPPEQVNPYDWSLRETQSGHAIVWVDPDNQPLAKTRWYYKQVRPNPFMPSKPGRVRMQTWKKFDSALNELLCMKMPKKRKIDDDTFTRLAYGDEADRIYAAIMADFNNVYHCTDAARSLYNDKSIEVRRRLAKNPIVGPNYWRRSAEDPDWRVRLSLCMNKAFIMTDDYHFFRATQLIDGVTRGIFANLARDPSFEVRLAASELLYHDEDRKSMAAVMENPYDDEFKIDMMMSKIGGGAD